MPSSRSKMYFPTQNQTKSGAPVIYEGTIQPDSTHDATDLAQKQSCQVSGVVYPFNMSAEFSSSNSCQGSNSDMILTLYCRSQHWPIQIPITRQPAENLGTTSTGFIFNEMLFSSADLDKHETWPNMPFCTSTQMLPLPSDTMHWPFPI